MRTASRRTARLLGVSVDISERKRAEQALEERLRFEQLLTELSATFINQPPDQIDGVIDDSSEETPGDVGPRPKQPGGVQRRHGACCW